MAARKEGWPQLMQRQNTQGKDKQDPTKALKQRFLPFVESLTPLKTIWKSSPWKKSMNVPTRVFLVKTLWSCHQRNGWYSQQNGRQLKKETGGEGAERWSRGKTVLQGSYPPRMEGGVANSKLLIKVVARDCESRPRRHKSKRGGIFCFMLK